MKYSNNFDRDYNFYFNNRKIFIFCGTLDTKFNSIHAPNGVTAKEAFYFIDAQGKNKPTREPELLTELLLCKASINFHIKMWAESRADGTLPLVEFSKKRYIKAYSPTKDFYKENVLSKRINEYCKIDDTLVIKYHRDIQKQFNLPEWVIDAVENQKVKFYK